MHTSMSRNSNRSNLSIGWFVALSLLLHLLLLWGVMYRQDVVPLPSPQQAANGLRINLTPYRVTQQSAEANRQAARVAENTEPTATAQTTNRNAVADSMAKPDGDNASVFHERIMVKLRQALAAHFSYPLLARQRNWQGEVLLAFRLERDGRISGAHIARSSGYGLLDHAALSALNRVGLLGEMLPRSLTVELPVIYRLES